jgi:blue copper oxidase
MSPHRLMGINGCAFALGRIDERVPLGDVEIWEISGQMVIHSFVSSRGGQ